MANYKDDPRYDEEAENERVRISKLNHEENTRRAEEHVRHRSYANEEDRKREYDDIYKKGWTGVVPSGQE